MTTFIATRPRALTHEGRTMSMKAWAAAKGIGYTTLSERLRSGWTVASALDTPVFKGPIFRTNAIVLTLNGRTQSARSWARETGLPYTTIVNRRGVGWTDEETLTTPLDLPRSERVKADRARERRAGVKRGGVK